MANNKNKKNEPAEIQKVDNALSRTERFFEAHYKVIIIALVAVLVVAGGIVLLRSQYFTPRSIEASDNMAQAQRYFEVDSFNLALNGDGINYGFLDIINSYGGTDAADLAKLYAAICYYNLEDYQSAISYAKECKSKAVNVTPVKITLIGDCYVAMDDYAAAANYFEKAAKEENKLTAPRALQKAGLCYEQLNDWRRAQACYNIIKDKYFDTQYAVEIDKYIERCEMNCQ